MSQIELRNFLNIERWRRWDYSRALRHEAGTNRQLARELPMVAKGYATLWSTHRRMARIARNAGAHQLSALVILENDSAIGVASAQSAVPVRTTRRSHFPNPGSVELSYWHGAIGDPERARHVGSQVVRQLIDTVQQSPYMSEKLWMVTLPQDMTKTAVLEATGFQPFSVPQIYDIHDGVRENRQLWSR